MLGRSRLLSLTVVLSLLLASSLSFTVAQPAVAQEQVELVYQNWTSSGEMPWETELIKKFEEAYPNIKIKLSAGPYEPHHNKIITATLAGSPPDVFQIIPEQIFAFASQNAVLSLDEYIEKEGGEQFSDQYFDSAWAMVDQAGHVYGLPWRYGVSSMFLNVSMFEEAGVPIPDGEKWTWDEFLEIAKKLTDKDKKQYGFAFSATAASFGTSWEWFGHAFASGVDLIVDGKATINSEAAVKSLEWWADLLNKEGVVPPETPTLDETAIVDLIGRGSVAMWNNGPWYINNFRLGYPDLEFTTLPLPRGEQDGASAGGTALSISPLSKHKDEAWTFIKFMTSEPILKEWATRGFFMPTRDDVLKEEIFQQPPMLAFSQSALRPNSKIIGRYPETPALFSILHSQMQEVFLKRKSAKEALDATAAEWDKIIAPYYAE